MVEVVGGFLALFAVTLLGAGTVLVVILAWKGGKAILKHDWNAPGRNRW